MNKLKKTYNEFITNKEKNKIKINERIEIMKENKRKKSYIFSFATIVTTVVMLIVGYYYFNNTQLQEYNIDCHNSFLNVLSYYTDFHLLSYDENVLSKNYCELP